MATRKKATSRSPRSRKARPRAKARAKARPRAKAKIRPTAKATAGSARIAPPRSFDTLIAPHRAAVRELAARLRALVRDAVPDADENVYGGSKVGIALYTIGGANRVVCGIQPSSETCLVYVHHVAADDSSSLRLEGTDKHTLHIKFHAINRDEEAALHALIRLARERLLD